MIRRVVASAYVQPRTIPCLRVARRGWSSWSVGKRLGNVYRARHFSFSFSMALGDLERYFDGSPTPHTRGPGLSWSFRECYAYALCMDPSTACRDELLMILKDIQCSPWRSYLSKSSWAPVCSEEDVSSSPELLHIWGDRPYLPMNGFECPDEFRRACDIDSTSTTIALHGERGAGKTPLAVSGPQCPVLYLNGPFEEFYPLPAAVAVRSDQCGTRWGQSVHCNVDRGPLAAAYVLSKILPTLQHLDLVAKWDDDVCSHMNLKDDVFADIKNLKETVDRATVGKEKMEKGKTIAVVLDNMHGTADFLRCLRQPGGQFLEDTLRRLLDVKKVIVVLVGAPRDIPDCVHVDVQVDVSSIDAPTATAEEQQRLAQVFKAVQGNGTLSACVSEMFDYHDDAMKMNIKGAKPETAASLITQGLSMYVRLGTDGAIQMTSPNACARAAALVLFQHDRVLMDRMVHGTGKKLTASGAVAQIVTTTPGTVPGVYMYRLSPAQWLAAAQVPDKKMRDWTSDRVDEASMECPFGPNSVPAFLRLTLRAAVSAQASVPQWIEAVRRAVSDPSTHSNTGFSPADGEGDGGSRSSLLDGITRRSDLLKYKVSTVFSRTPVALDCDASDAVLSRLSKRKVVLLVNGEARDSFIVFFPTGVCVFLQLKPVHVSVGRDTVTVPGLGIATSEVRDSQGVVSAEELIEGPKTQLEDTPFWFPQNEVSVAHLFFSGA